MHLLQGEEWTGEEDVSEIIVRTHKRGRTILYNYYVANVSMTALEGRGIVTVCVVTALSANKKVFIFRHKILYLLY